MSKGFKYEVWAVTDSACIDGKCPMLGAFNSFKKARKCVSEFSIIYSFIKIVDKSKYPQGGLFQFFRNRKI